MSPGQRVRVAAPDLELDGYHGKVGTVLSAYSRNRNVFKVEMDEGKVHVFFANYELEVIG